MAFDPNKLRNAMRTQKTSVGVEPSIEAKPIQEQPVQQHQQSYQPQQVQQQYQPQHPVQQQNYQPQYSEPVNPQPNMGYQPQPQYHEPVSHQPVNPGYAQPMYSQPQQTYQQPVHNSLAVAMPTSEVIERIMQNEHISDVNQIEVYEPQSPIVDPIQFSIRDTTGAIGLRVKAIEEKYNISVIPFKLAKLNPAIEFIQGYDILKIGDELYASANDHMVNKMVLENFERKCIEQVSNGQLVEEVLNVTLDVNGYGTINTLMFNRYELDYLYSRFINVGPRIFNVQGTYKFTVGIY